MSENAQDIVNEALLFLIRKDELWKRYVEAACLCKDDPDLDFPELGYVGPVADLHRLNKQLLLLAEDQFVDLRENLADKSKLNQLIWAYAIKECK